MKCARCKTGLTRVCSSPSSIVRRYVTIEQIKTSPGGIQILCSIICNMQLTLFRSMTFYDERTRLNRLVLIFHWEYFDRLVRLDDSVSGARPRASLSRFKVSECMRCLDTVVHHPRHLWILKEELPAFPTPTKVLHACTCYIVQKLLELPGLHCRRLKTHGLLAVLSCRPLVVSIDPLVHVGLGR